MSLEDLAAMDAEIGTLRESIATSKANEKLIRASLVSVNATMSSEELHNTVAQLEHEKKEILARLVPLRAGNVKPVLREEKEAVQKEWRGWSKKAGVRKKICMELWEMCTEVIEEGKTKEELWVRRVLGSGESITQLLICSDIGGVGAGGRWIGSMRNHTWLERWSDGEELSGTLCYAKGKSTTAIPDGGIGSKALPRA